MEKKASTIGNTNRKISLDLVRSTVDTADEKSSEELSPEAQKKIANNLFWAVFFINGEKAHGIIETSKQRGDLAQILQSGWMRRLLINNEKAQKLA
ncbi:MAG: hypothetical protein PV340_02380 [Wolbachia sp.]|nr:hypothetical protein [Wolbachia sp.]MDD9336277.1 hypothetical protein [Wolbachia sp.]